MVSPLDIIAQWRRWNGATQQAHVVVVMACNTSSRAGWNVQTSVHMYLPCRQNSTLNTLVWGLCMLAHRAPAIYWHINIIAILSVKHTRTSSYSIDLTEYFHISLSIFWRVLIWKPVQNMHHLSWMIDSCINSNSLFHTSLNLSCIAIIVSMYCNESMYCNTSI